MNEKLLALGLGCFRFVTGSGMCKFVRLRAEDVVGCVGVQGMMIRQRVGLLDVGPRGHGTSVGWNSELRQELGQQWLWDWIADRRVVNNGLSCLKQDN